MRFRIIAGDSAATAAWAGLRAELWPETPVDEHRREIVRLLESAPDAASFLALDANDQIVGFAEATLRHEYVNGCDTSPVAFLEAVFVRPSARRIGLARTLIDEVEQWARGKGVTELASDAIVDNDVSLAMHAASGFEETERVVYFRKQLHAELPPH